MTPVEGNGALSVKGGKLTNNKGKVIQLSGMSLFWSQWGYDFWKKEVVEHLYTNWGVSVIRCPVGSHKDHPGYESNLQEELDKLYKVIDEAIVQGIYVIVDCHNHYAYKDPSSVSKAMGMLTQVAQKYGDIPNIIYEVINEPLGVSWEEIEVFSHSIIKSIRSFAPNSVALVGVPDWCKDLSCPSKKPLSLENIMYTFHFYAATHSDIYLGMVESYVELGLPVFISECGVSEHTGSGRVDFDSFDKWISLMDRESISWCAWAYFNKHETSNVGVPGSNPVNYLLEDQLTDTGLFLRNRIKSTKISGGGVYRPFFPSSIGDRYAENRYIQELERNSVPVPNTFFKYMVPFLIREGTPDNLEGIVLWVKRYWWSFNREIKSSIKKEVVDKIGNEEDSLDKWVWYRLYDTLVFLEEGKK